MKLKLIVGCIILLLVPIQFTIGLKCDGSKGSPTVRITNIVGLPTATEFPEKIYGVGQQLLIPRNLTSFVLNCSSPLPIRWSFKDSPFANTVTKVEKYIEWEEEGEESRPCYNVNLILASVTEEITGNYTCQKYIASERVNFELYSGDRNPSFPGALNFRGKTHSIVRKKKSKTIMLPCTVNDPSKVPFLFVREGLAKEWNQVKHFAYTPLGGFVVDKLRLPISNMSQLTFECRLHTENDSFSTLYTQSDLEVYPSSNQTYSLASSWSQVFWCESESEKVEIRSTFLIDGVTTSRVESIENPNRATTIIAYKRNPHSAPSGSTNILDCIQVNNNVTLYPWSFKIIEDEDASFYEKGRSIVDSKTRQMTCGTIDPDNISCKFIPCTNSEECALLSPCLLEKPLALCNPAFTLPLNRKGKFAVTTVIPKSSGKLRCYGEETNIYKVYFLATDKTSLARVLAVTDNSSATVAHSIRISCSNNEKSVTVGEILNCNCQTTKRLYLDNIFWELKWKNGTSSVLSSEFSEGNEGMKDENFYSNGISVQLFSTEIAALSCGNFFASTNDSYSDKLDFNISEAEIYIHGPEVINNLIENKESHIKLSCEASSYPTPNITWKYPDTLKADRVLIKFETKSTTIFSTLEIMKLEKIDEIQNITCRAFNPLHPGKDVVKTFRFYHYAAQTNYAGLVLGFLVIILVGVIIVLLTLRYMRMKSIEPENNVEIAVQEFYNGSSTNSVMGESLNDGYVIAQMASYDWNTFEIDFDRITITKDAPLLGLGAFGIVAKGTVDKDGVKVDVAVKTPRPNWESTVSLMAELKVMIHVGIHNNIAELIGASTSRIHSDNTLHILIRFYRNGSLSDHLRNLRTMQGMNLANIMPDLNMDLKRWALETCEGMKYLAEKKVIHGDLATRNLLLDDDFTIKVADFGFSRRLYHYCTYESASKRKRLPWAWLPLESLRYFHFSEKSDVWAFGVTLWEIFSLAEVPYLDRSWDAEFMQFLEEGHRLGKPIRATDSFYEIMQNTWQEDPRDRPTFQELKVRLEEDI